MHQISQIGCLFPVGFPCAQWRARAPSDNELEDSRRLQWLRSWSRCLLLEVSKNWAEKTYNVKHMSTVRILWHKQRILLCGVGRFLWACFIWDMQNQSFFPKEGPLGWFLQLLHRVSEGSESSIPCSVSIHIGGKGELVGQVHTSPQASLHTGSWNGVRLSSSKRWFQESWPLHRQLPRASPIWWNWARPQLLAEVGAMRGSPCFCNGQRGWLWSQPCFQSCCGMPCSDTVGRVSPETWRGTAERNGNCPSSHAVSPREQHFSVVQAGEESFTQ